MKDEIKEILAYFEKYVKITDMHDSEPMLNWKDLKIVLDYITNLQTIEQQYSALLSENAELENKITNLQEESEKQEELISRLYSIIDDDKENFKLLDEENEKIHKELDYADNYNIYLISKIDKTIEYIVNNCDFQKIIISDGDNDKIIKIKELLNILQGEDKDE